MALESRKLKFPRCIKYILCAFLFISGVVFLLNTGVSKHIRIYKTHELTADDSAAIEMLLEARHISSKTNSTTFSSELNYTGLSTQEMNTFDILEEDPRPCFLKLALDTKDLEKHDGTRSEMDPKTIGGQGTHSYLYMVFIFNKILASLDIKAAVIEPSILHCLLKPKYKELLKRRNVTIADSTKSRTTYGMLRSDADKLQKEDVISKFRSFGYQPHFVHVPLASWMLQNKTDTDSNSYTGHIFFVYYEWIIHVVVFQNRSKYLWHSALRGFPDVPEEKNLIFVDYDSAYEKFCFFPLKYKHPSLASIYVPSNPQHFLFQMASSRFLECNLTRAESVRSSKNTPTAHSYLSVEEFNDRALDSLIEVKKFFNPLLMNFWIFSGTMLGWYRQCDVIPYTTDVDFGAWASEIDDLDYIVQYFRNNKELTIIERMGVLEEALEFQLRYKRLRVDVFFLYKISNGSWASGHRPSQGYYFRYHYPPFSLCSAELLGEKVNVPCETEKVIVTEYGPNWMKPVSSWNYESSIKNRGPNIYWDEKRRSKAFEEF